MTKEFHVTEKSLAQADETLITLNSNGVAFRRINSGLRKAGPTKLLKLGCIGSFTPFVLADGTALMNLVVIKATEGREVTMNIPLEAVKALLLQYFLTEITLL